MEIKPLLALAGEFMLAGQPASVHECENGNINKTYIITVDSGKKYILQRINTNVFKKPDEVMENIIGITSYLRKKIAGRGGDPTRETLTLIPVKTGGYAVIDGDGGYWRMYDFIRDTVSYEMIEREGQFYNAGYAFGDFQKLLSDYPADTLFETIPHFHDTPSRYEDFRAALENNAANRAGKIGAELEFIEANRALCPFITDGIADGRFPLRVTHNDTKLNNIMMDVATDTAVCVIDLDTVMPGSMLFDYGDAIRYGASNAGEDETDLSKVFIRPDLFSEFTRGFLNGSGGAFNKHELAALPTAPAVIAIELAMRFLTDYLNGDTYFIVRYPENNLDRARTQLALCKNILDRTDELSSVVSAIISR